MRIPLRKAYFCEAERVFVADGELRASIFRYSTGVDAVKIENSLGHIIILPFKGQMIWAAEFCGRSITLHRVNKGEPKNVAFFLDTWGSFFFHCGALRMGCPSENDDHPLHGELPYADYDEAEIVCGRDDNGNYIGLTGKYNYNRGFGACYSATPEVRVHAASSLLDIMITIDNLSELPMELMYQAHLNFRAAENGRIVQSFPWDPESMQIRTTIPLHFKIDNDYAQLIETLKTDPRRSEILRPEDIYKPEITFYMYNAKTDSQGLAHIMQVHPDGSADFMKFNPAVLEHSVRWITKYCDQHGLGLAFPSTCNPEGYNSEKAKGHIKYIPPNGSWHMSLTAGYLNPMQAAAEEVFIDRLCADT